jgi:DNA topoisomerase IB
MPRLRRADPARAGWTRRRAGLGFSYSDAQGRRLSGEDRERCERLAIPPAWTDVWICPWPNGHLQAVGTDAAGRRQYLYHPAWRERRDREKFDRVLEFGRSLSSARRRVAEDLALPGVPRERALAAAFLLLDLANLRIGGETYAQSNGSVGVATLRREHVSTRGDAVRLRFPGKSGVEHDVVVVDADLAAAVHDMRRRRSGSPELLAYQQDGEWRDVTTSDINAYVSEVTAGNGTAKDFRTWHGTVRALAALADQEPPRTQRQRRAAVAQAMRVAADHLGNTPAVARSAYVDPRVVGRFLDGEPLVEEGLDAADALDGEGDDDEPTVRAHGDAIDRWEAAVLQLLAPDDEESAAPASTTS